MSAPYACPDPDPRGFEQVRWGLRSDLGSGEVRSSQAGFLQFQIVRLVPYRLTFLPVHTHTCARIREDMGQTVRKSEKKEKSIITIGYKNEFLTRAYQKSERQRANGPNYLKSHKIMGVNSVRSVGPWSSAGGQEGLGAFFRCRPRERGFLQVNLGSAPTWGSVRSNACDRRSRVSPPFPSKWTKNRPSGCKSGCICVFRAVKSLENCGFHLPRKPVSQTEMMCFRCQTTSPPRRSNINCLVSKLTPRVLLSVATIVKGGTPPIRRPTIPVPARVCGSEVFSRLSHESRKTGSYRQGFGDGSTWTLRVKG